MLTRRRSKVQYTLDTDDWNKEGACVLIQKYEDGTNSLAGYWFRRLNGKELKLATTHGEFQTATWAVPLLQLYFVLDY